MSNPHLQPEDAIKPQHKSYTIINLILQLRPRMQMSVDNNSERNNASHLIHFNELNEFTRTCLSSPLLLHCT